MRNTWWNFRFLVKLLKYLTIPANITCSKSTIKTLEEVAKKCLKLTIKTPERGQWCHSGVINIKFEHISRLLLLFLLLTLSIVYWDGTIIAASLKITFYNLNPDVARPFAYAAAAANYCARYSGFDEGNILNYYF